MVSACHLSTREVEKRGSNVQSHSQPSNQIQGKPGLYKVLSQNKKKNRNKTKQETTRPNNHHQQQQNHSYQGVKLGVVLHICSLGTQEAEAERSPDQRSLRSAWMIWQSPVLSKQAIKV